MGLNILLFIGGLFVLSLGARWVVNGAGNIALSFGIRPFIIGVTIIAFGTSLPELVFNIAAQLKHSSDLGIGNIIGSNIANLALVMGVSAVIRPLHVERRVIWRELPILLVITVFFYLISRDGVISHWDGLSMLFIFCLYLFYLTKSAAVDPNFTIPVTELNVKEKKSRKIKDISMTIIGLLFLVAGARLMVESSIFIARSFGISELVIGLTIVAVGTSLPELAASIGASYKKEADLSVGNVIGSNIINILLIIGLIAAIDTLTINNELTLQLYFPIMLGLTAVMYIIILIRRKLGRPEGFVLVLFYFVYTWLCYQSN